MNQPLTSIAVLALLALVSDCAAPLSPLSAKLGGEAREHQLAHAERNSVSAAYNFAEHLPERRKMMQAWADYLDALKSHAEITFKQP